jgi:uncharacterized protein YecT (DUF1311 family)
LKARATLLAALSLVAACQQRSEPSEPQATEDPCSGATKSNLEYTECWQNLAMEARSEADTTYEHARQVANSSDKREEPWESDEAKLALGGSLPDSQEAWAKFYDRQCLFEGRIARGGTGTRAIVAKCQHRLSLQRAAELEDAIKLIEGNS